jgi:tetratricopeptide (TPR) repeat protein
MVSPLPAQPGLEDVPKVLKQDPAAPKSKEAESLKQFALGLLCEKDDRLLEALQAYEKAAELDPSAVPVLRKLLAIYTALDRGQDALAASRKIIELDPKDAQSWHLHARQLQNQGKTSEAVAALKKGIKHFKADDLDLGQQMYFDLGMWESDLKRSLPAAAAYLESARCLKQALKDMELDAIQKKEIRARLVMLHERAGKIFVGAKQYEQALEAYREAQKYDTSVLGTWQLNLAQIYYAQGKYTEALASVNDYLKLQPQGLEAYELKLTLLEKLNKKQEVLPWLLKAADNDPFNVNLQLFLADWYQRDGQTQKAEMKYLKLAKESPRADIYVRLFGMYRKTPGSGLPKAVDLVNKTVEQTDDKDLASSNHARLQVKAMLAALHEDPSLTKDLLQAAMPLLQQKNELHIQTIRALAFLADGAGDAKAAEAFYQAAMKKITPETEAVIYDGLLRALWANKKYEEMLQLCEEGLQKADSTPHALFHQERALALARLKKFDQAVDSAKKAVATASPSNRVATQRLYLSLLVQARQFDTAEAECQKLLKESKQPGDIVEFRMALAGLYSVMRNFPKAENELQLVLKADPNNMTACNDLGYLWADQGKNLKDAEELIRKALELYRDQRKTLARPQADPKQDKAEFVDSLGWVLFRQGKLEEAHEELSRALKLPGGDDAVIWDHLGDVCFKLKRSEEARQCWHKALNLHEEAGTPETDSHYRDLKVKVKLLKSANP